jgi:hypothetical protein
MNFCKDCSFAYDTMPNHQSQSSLGLAGYAWRCDHPSASRPAAPPSPVTGFVEPPTQMSCPEARGYSMQAACGPQGRFWEAREDPLPELSGVIGFGEAGKAVFDALDALGEALTPGDRGANLAASIVEEPIGENDEGAWEWCWLSPEDTGLPWKIWLCDIAPVVILGEDFLPRREINQLYRWMKLNNEVLETLGLYSSAEMLQRLRRLP